MLIVQQVVWNCSVPPPSFYFSPFPLPLKYISMSTFTSWYLLAGKLISFENSVYITKLEIRAHFYQAKGGATFSVVPENGEHLGVFIVWVTSGEGWRGQPQITLNMFKKRCLQHLESGLVVKHSNQAEQTMWTDPGTVESTVGPAPLVYLASTCHSMMNAPRCNNMSENNSCGRLKQHWLFSRTEAKCKFHNLKRSKQEMNGTYYRK